MLKVQLYKSFCAIIWSILTVEASNYIISFLWKAWQPVDRKILFKYSAMFWFVPSSPVFSGVRVTWSLVLYVCFLDLCLPFCTYSFGHCVVCSSSIYGFWLPPFGIFKLFLDTIYTIILIEELCFQNTSIRNYYDLLLFICPRTS